MSIYPNGSSWFVSSKFLDNVVQDSIIKHLSCFMRKCRSCKGHHASKFHQIYSGKRSKANNDHMNKSLWVDDVY